ncbi:MAG: thiamine phosphate synthase [Proteobacteria bacterium]|nr:thiamine phosphate synthase [Pseudomonadota bacterium]
MRHLLKKHLRLCLVTNIKNRPIDEYKKFVQAAVRGGVTMVQLREKEGDIEAIRYKALEINSVLKPLGIPLIINDLVELAAEIGVAGVHIGQQDMSPAQARSILGPGKIIGVSIESMEELNRANADDAISYVTASAVYPSKTKTDCKTIWGLDGLNKVVMQSRHPVTSIGGIKAHNVAEIMTSGACGIAVIGAVHDAEDPYEAACELMRYINSGVGRQYAL